MSTERPQAAEVYTPYGEVLIGMPEDHQLYLKPGASVTVRDVQGTDQWVRITAIPPDIDADSGVSKMGKAFGFALSIFIGIPLLITAFLLIVFLIQMLVHAIAEAA